jgi:hypothetical protein
MSKTIEILERAISDIGVCSWWSQKLPDIFQIEFRQVLLWNPPIEDGNPPSGQIALRFIHPVHVSFLSTESNDISDEERWYNLLKNDKIEPINIKEETFVINNKKRTMSILKNVPNINNYYGNKFKRKYLNANFSICFWNGETGMIVCSDNMEIYNHIGEIELSSIPQISQKWWEYWEKYWELKDKDNALPIDFSCEVTIPIKTS